VGAIGQIGQIGQGVKLKAEGANGVSLDWSAAGTSLGDGRRHAASAPLAAGARVDPMSLRTASICVAIVSHAARGK